MLALERDPGKGKISGFCAALADYYGVDPLLVRTLFVVAALSSGIGVVLYLAGWALTPASTTGRAPVDRLGPRWRNLSPRTLVWWAIGLTAVTAIVLGSFGGLGWTPLIIVALTILTGQRTHHRARPTVYRFPTPQAAAAARQRAIERGSQARRKPRPTDGRRSTGPLTLLVILLALAAGGGCATLWPGDPTLVVSAALATVGLGLVVLAWRGRAVGLIVFGVVCSLALALTAAVGPTPLRTQQHIETLSSGEQTVVSSEYSLLDAGDVRVEQDTEWELTVDSSSVVLQLPADENIQVETDYSNTVIVMDDQAYAGNGRTAWGRHPDPDGPTLIVHITTWDSVVVVRTP
ncbi:hypothetical protein GCM10009785_05050 [Brooklawnia cerclae]|uniref:Phage shock protein PspC (Stress-responsive transcriptional regulator) n=1 Tax=Brooklawnia cerclae TaxID=349934 RepID=A0ABX0SBY8_9ACTN|nr:PspC domain-containing protein [Brooklawnia cerclae]NIH55903.1 phage shock protein PspC (stress-responsive transcriptional regulator) [Brooklawnia cerclae]